MTIVALALAASANSLANWFAYDDMGLIVNSPRMHSLDGWWREFARTYWPGGDGYRPLTILAFRLQWVMGDGAPLVFHAVNVALHVATSVVVLWMATGFLPLSGAWTAAALYAVHPVHVEAIANVVGQSELFVALLVVLAAGLYVHGRSRGHLTGRRWVAIGALYAAGCLFKEHAILLPALLVLAEATVVRDPTPLRHRVVAMRLPLLSLVAVALCYLWPRSAVVVDGFTGFAPDTLFWALEISAADRILTMVGAAIEWLRLLLWPARLMVHYSPPYIDLAHGPALSQLPGFLVLAGTLGLMIACWRRSPTTSFGIAWLVITLLPASNFLIPAGFLIAERTLLLPSVGAMIALGSAAPWIVERLRVRPPLRVAALGALGVLIGLGIARSYTRNRVWHDDERLIRQGVRDAPDSYRAHMHLGVWEFSSGRYREGMMAYNRAIQLFPHDPQMAWAYAEHLRAAGHCDVAIPIYRWLFTAQPEGRRGHLGHAACLLQRGRLDEAQAEATLWLQRGGRLSLYRELLASVKAARDSTGPRTQ
jgi:hypothetical protein